MAWVRRLCVAALFMVAFVQLLRALFVWRGFCTPVGDDGELVTQELDDEAREEGALGRGEGVV